MAAPLFETKPWLLAPVALIAAAHAGEVVEVRVAPDCTLGVIRVDAGGYDQGSPETEPDRKPDETRRRVTLTRGFDLGRTPVTRAQFAAFAAATGYRTEAEKGKSGGFGLVAGELRQAPQFNWRNPGFAQTDTHPVVLVTHGDAEAFCRWVAAKTGRACRLPTEAEWEYACRADTATAWYDERGADAVARHRDNATPAGTAPVAQRAANAWGFFDMPGHVREWCADWYAPRDAAAATDPLVTVAPAGEKARRVQRGASFLQGPASTRSAARGRAAPGSRNADTGFRVLLELPADKPAGALTLFPAESPAAPAAPKPCPDCGKIHDAPASAPSAPAQAVVPTPIPAGFERTPANPEIAFRAPASTSPFPFGLLIIGGGIAAVVVLVIRKLASDDDDARYRRDPRPGPSRLAPTAGNPFEPEPAAFAAGITPAREGFWIAAEIAEPGATVRYRWRRAGRWTEGATRFAPGSRTGGQFIYTGAMPEAVEILELHPADPGDERPFDPAPYRPDRDANDAFTRGAATGWMLGNTMHHTHHRHDTPAPRPRYTSRPSAY